MKQAHGEDGAVRVSAIGDAMGTDILGAHKEGWDSILVADGIHASDLGVKEGAGEPVEAKRLEQWVQDFTFQPTHVVPTFGIIATSK